MEIKQIYELMNEVTKEILGEEAIVEEDLSNVVDLGEEIFNASAVDHYVKTLVNHIGKVVFVNRPYAGAVPSVLMDSWEFGSVLEKITCKLPDAEENEAWELEDGQSYDPNIFYQPEVSAKFFNKRVTFEIPMSFTERQVKESFDNATQLNAFISMLYTAVEKSMTIKLDSLVMRTINAMTAETIYDDYQGGTLSAKSGVKAINLLKLYNTKFDKTLTAEASINDPEFLRFASVQMGIIAKRLTRPSTRFNIGGTDKFTSREFLHLVLLADFEEGAKGYLYSDTFNEEYVKMPTAETVPYWQGSGEDYSFSDITAVNVKTAANHTVSATGVIGVMFDRDALGVANLDRRTTSNYNPKGEFYNNWFKMDAGYFNDTNENFIVFFVA